MLRKYKSSFENLNNELETTRDNGDLKKNHLEIVKVKKKIQ